MTLLENIPNRPLRESTLKEVQEAGGYELVQPVASLIGEFSPYDEPAADEFVVIAEEWVGAYVLEADGWKQVFDDGRLAEEEGVPDDVDLMMEYTMLCEYVNGYRGREPLPEPPR